MKKKHFFSGRGFYAALAVVIGGSALASYLAVNAMLNKLSTPHAESGVTGQEEIEWQQNAPAQQNQENVPKPSSSVSSSAQNTQPSSGSQGAASSQSAEPAALQPAQARSFVWPVQGEISVPFSGDELVFNETMHDWRTHNGVDIAAAKGANVKAPAAATVTAVRQDAQWGGVVELDANGTVLRVCGLAGLTVKQGDTVKSAQVLGTVGDLPAEGALGAHIHFEAERDGAFLDPATLVA